MARYSCQQAEYNTKVLRRPEAGVGGHRPQATLGEGEARSQPLASLASPSRVLPALGAPTPSPLSAL